MSETATTPQFIKEIKFKINLILFFITWTVWSPFFNLIAFQRLNELAKIPVPEGVPKPKNSAIANFLLCFSTVGLPFVLYNRYKLLRNYISAMENHLPALPTKNDEEGNEIKQTRINCLPPKKIVSFAIATFFVLVLFTGSLTIVIVYLALYFQGELVGNNIWDNGAFMIFMPLAIGGLLVSIGFCTRMGIEEKRWVKAFNAITQEVTKKYL